MITKISQSPHENNIHNIELEQVLGRPRQRLFAPGAPVALRRSTNDTVMHDSCSVTRKQLQDSQFFTRTGNCNKKNSEG